MSQKKEINQQEAERVLFSTIAVIPTFASTFVFEVCCPTLPSTIHAMTIGTSKPLWSPEFDITNAIVESIEGHGIRSIIRSECGDGHHSNQNAWNKAYLFVHLDLKFIRIIPYFHIHLKWCWWIKVVGGKRFCILLKLNDRLD